MNVNTGFTLRGKRLKIPMRVVAPLLALLLLVGPFQIISSSTGGGQVQAQIETCTSPAYEAVVQDCLMRLAFRALEQQAIDDLLAAHQLPATDRNRLIGWERDAIRAAIFTSMIAIIEKAPAERTSAEQGLVGTMADLVQQRRIAAAQYSIDQYNVWKDDPCSYTAPYDYDYPYPSQCATPIGEIFDSISPPSLEEFLAYGNAHIYAEFVDDGAASAISAEAARMIGLVSGLLVAGIAAGIGAFVGASLLTVGGTVMLAIHPFLYAYIAGSTGPAALQWVGSVAAGAVGGLSIAAVIGIVITAIVLIVIQGISVFTDEAIPGQLQDNMDDAVAPVNLSQLITTTEGVTELFVAFILETTPDFPSQSPVPAQQPTDRTFVVTDPQGSKSHSQTLNYQCWNPVNCGGNPEAARLSDGWFVSRNSVTGVERMALGIDYVDWEGDAWTAWRVGPQEFLHTRTGDDSEPFVSEEIKFKAEDGSLLTATINKPPTKPGTPVVGLAVNRGEFRVAWLPSTDPDGDPVTYILQHCGGFGTITTGGCDNDMRIHGLTTPYYDFTSDSPESHGNWTYRVRALDGESSGAISDFSDTVLVDKRPPFITFLDSTPANANGWNNSNVLVRWTCTDSLELEINPANAGVVDAIVGRIVSSEGEDQSATQACTDKAGNVTPDTVTGINVDKTPPVASHTGPYRTSEGTTISLDGTGSSDALSGINSISWAVDQDDVFDDGNPASFTPADGPEVYDVKLRVEDLAGNVTTVGTTVKSDNVAPTINTPTSQTETSDEGDLVLASASFNDSGADDTHTCEIDWGDGTDQTVGAISAKVCSGSHVYADDNPTGTGSDEYTVMFTITDDDNATSSHGLYVQTVNNVAPVVSVPSVNPSASNEAQQVAASAEFTDAGVPDTHTCEIDWGDGTLPVAGMLSGRICSGLHTYADDDVPGTSSDPYTITFSVVDDDGGMHDNSYVHTVNNVAPSIDAINVPDVLDHATVTSVSVDASDAAGSLDPLTYAFDCDGNGTFETDSGSSTSASCLPDPTTLSPTVGAQVSDDDTGVSTKTVELYVEKSYCANMYTGSLRDSASCRASERVVTLRPDEVELFCASVYSGTLRYSTTSCGPNTIPLTVPAADPLTICQNQYTGALSYRSSRCIPAETTMLIPSR